MIEKNPTEELVFRMMQSKKNSFHFGEISLGVQKLLEEIKQKGYVVHFVEKGNTSEPKLVSKEDCLASGLSFEHQIIDLRNA